MCNHYQVYPTYITVSSQMKGQFGGEARQWWGATAVADVGTLGAVAIGGAGVLRRVGGGSTCGVTPKATCPVLTCFAGIRCRSLDSLATGCTHLVTQGT